MARVHLKLNATATDIWLTVISTDFPDAEFRILSSHPVDDGMVAIDEITMLDGNAIARRYDDAPEVRSSEVIHSDVGMVQIQYVAEVPELYEVLSATGTLPRFPVSIRDEWLSIELTASLEQLGEFTTELAAADIPYQIVSLTQSYDSNGLLTERQREVITEAVERGYYDSPRGCTLIELAETFEVNQSAASGVLHRAEGRIIKEFIS
ncbi:helix-turn-helix domain-containing protein [Haladaptatus halobius]|uniref:helix-turn-helix domain-containing protein n=1 Tax=Haladaptatus halobius TaxID=2884875 RepID=UPI001D0AC403|nr:helix-turn-helix domain-containing protein [Haladaptatus halobius]